MLPAVAAVPSGLAAQSQAPNFRLHPGVVAYSFRKNFANRMMTYNDLVHLASDCGLDGIDTTGRCEKIKQGLGG